MKHFFICVLTLLIWSGNIGIAHSAPSKKGFITSKELLKSKSKNRFSSKFNNPSSQKKWEKSPASWKKSPKSPAKEVLKKSAFSSKRKIHNKRTNHNGRRR